MTADELTEQILAVRRKYVGLIEEAKHKDARRNALREEYAALSNGMPDRWSCVELARAEMAQELKELATQFVTDRT